MIVRQAHRELPPCDVAHCVRCHPVPIIEGPTPILDRVIVALIVIAFALAVVAVMWNGRPG